ncbi:MAG: hypothetical protein FJ320_12790 [SAR202 cluster bacterium]|nr:hypothetical protein [SAR202 cluster bacterium]
MDKVEIAQKVMAVDVAFGTFVAILQASPQDNLSPAGADKPQRIVTGVMGRMGRAARSYFESIVLRPINGAVSRSMAQVRVVKNRVRIGN